MPVTCSVAFVYPRLFALHSLEPDVGDVDTDGSLHLPTSLPLMLEKLDADGAYLVEDSSSMYVWIGRSTPASFLESVLQVRSMNGMQCSRLRVFAIDNPLSIRVNKLMNAVRAQRPHLLQTVRVVTHKDPLEARFLGLLTEDRAQTSMSYVEFLCHIHRQIQQKFN
mmetsp:Transcript_20454/g.34894  ORF Transcript_20454/g.34894 Transcript_20454/m.34894 type:complete len:166 (+) Transcript_20454:3-500(+)